MKEKAIQYDREKVIETLPRAFARHRIVTEAGNKPADYEFLTVNAAFEEATGLRREDIIGHRVTEVLPGIVEGNFDWIGEFGKVAQGGGTMTFEQYSAPLDRWYEVSAYSDAPDHFTTVFNDISDRRAAIEAIERNHEKMRLLLEVSQAISGERELRTLSQTIVDSIVKLTDLTSSAIYLIRDDSLYLDAAYPPLPDDFPESLRIAETADHPHIARAISGKKPVVMADSTKADLTAAERWVCEVRNLLSNLYIPLIYQDRSIGVLIVSSVMTTFGFSAGMIDLCRILAGQAALSLTEARRKAEQERYLQDIEAKNRELQQADAQVRKSEKRFADILRFADTIAFVTLDTDPGHPVILDFSPGAERMFGCGKDEMIGREAAVLHTEEQAALIPDIMRSLLARETVYSGEFTLVKKQGDHFPALVKYHPMYDEQGELKAVIGAGIDISELKQAEDRLKKSEEKHRQLFETMSQGVVYQEVDGKIFSLNPAAERILGFSPDRAPGEPAEAPNWEMIDEAGRIVPAEEFPSRLALRSGSMVGPLIRGLYRPDLDTFIWLSITAIPLFRPGEQAPFQAYAVFDDITERRAAEREIHHIGERYQALLYYSSLLISEFDLEGRYLMVNPAVAELFSLSVDELRGRSFREFLPPDIAAAFMERIERVGRTKAPVSVIDHIPVAGAVRHYSTTIFPLNDKSGSFHSLGSVSHDITELIEAEEERENLQNQLAQSQKMEAIGQLAGGIAHDFNNMLNVILGYSEIVMERLSEHDPARDELEMIHIAAERSANLTRQLLAFARKQAVHPRVIDLNDTISDLFAMLERLIGENITLLWLPGDDPGKLLIDPSQIDQILVNLCVNAREAISDTGRITLETSRIFLSETYCAAHPESASGEYLVIAVSDNGCGMDEATRARMFEPFFTTKGPGKGTGLGLATVFGIVRQNDGFINVYSEPGSGTTIRVYLPVLPDSGTYCEAAAAPLAFAAGSETILLADDDEMVRELAARILAELGYTVLSAGSPTEALELGGNLDTVDMLITDVIMPDMNGRMLYEKLLEKRPQLKCLYISGYTSNVIVHHGIVDEGVRFLQKPFSRSSLAGKVREVLDSGAESRKGLKVLR